MSLNRTRWLFEQLILAASVLVALAAPVSLLAGALPEEGSKAAAIDPMDWSNWRGPEQNGISRERGLPDKWDLDGENLLWKSEELATRSTPIVMRGKLYTLARSEPDTPREGEKVICADAATGKILWESKFNVFLSDVPDTRVAWSCVVGDPTTGNVYAMGVNGYFQCLNGETGKALWTKSLTEEFGLLSTYGGRTNVPVVFEDLVIINGVVIGWGEKAKPVHTFLAFNKKDGTLIWTQGTRLLPDDTTYSTPTLAVLGGEAAIVFGSGDGAVWALQPRTGVVRWQFQLSQRGLNLSPLIDGDTVYMGQSEENPTDSSMGALAAIDGTGKGNITATGAKWLVKERMIGKSSPVLVDGVLYAADDSGTVFAVNSKDGTLVGKPGKQKLLGSIMRASLLYADGKIYACTTSALHVLEPTKDGVKIVHRQRLPNGEEVYGSPIVSHGRLYLPTTNAIYCMALKDQKPEISERPTAPAEEAIGENKTPAHVQIVPAETLIKPGEKVQYKARLFNDRGQFLEETSPKYAVTGPAKIDATGQLAADAKAGHSAAIVTATSGKLTGEARTRIVPPLPWKFDFSDGEVPITWIGARYRHVPREVDGEKLIVKISTIPKGTRSQSMMGPIDLHDYTIQADVMSKPAAVKSAAEKTEAEKTDAEREGVDEAPPSEGAASPHAAGMADIGLVAQRYTLRLMGSHQQLQVLMWASQPNRFSKAVPYEWKPNVWYTLKFEASQKGDRAVLRAKVWPRGEKEPSSWLLEAEDVAPNLHGTPGLFGNATNSEIFLDNVSVTPNK